MPPDQSNTRTRAPSSQIFVEDVADFTEWQNIADRCDSATFFHTPEWYSVFAKTFPQQRIEIKKITFDDGKIAYLPFIQYSKFRFLHKSYSTGPAGVYGGWVCADVLDNSQVSQVMEWVFKNYPNIRWRINPFLENAEPALQRYATNQDTTELLYIDKFDAIEPLRNNYKRSVRKEIRKAERSNIYVTVARDWHEWQTLFELYQSAVKRWQTDATNNYPLRIFENLFNLESQNIKLWLVKIGGKIIGGNLNFYHNRHCVEWLAAFDSEFFGSGARNLLVDRIIEDALLNGYRYYDFNPSGEHEGTRNFKQSFGTSQLACDLIVVD